MFIGLLQEEPTYGADVLRLWVSSVDYTGDVLIGPQILRQMSDMYRKLRGTMRFLLANLHDWKVRPCDQTCLHLFSDNKCASNHQGNEWTRSMWRNILLGPGHYFNRSVFLNCYFCLSSCSFYRLHFNAHLFSYVILIILLYDSCYSRIIQFPTVICQKLTSMHFSNWKQLWLLWRIVMKITNSLKYIRYVYIFCLCQFYIFDLFSVLPFLFFIWILQCVCACAFSCIQSVFGSLGQFHLIYCARTIFLLNRKYRTMFIDWSLNYQNINE